MARKRSDKRRNWPKNLYVTRRKDGRLYYYYLRPDLEKGDPDRTQIFGYVTEREAIDAAEQLNRVFARGAQLVETVLRKSSKRVDEYTTVADYVDRFTSEVLPARRVKGQPLSSYTLREYNRLYKNIVAGLNGKRRLSAVTQSQLAQFLQEIGTTPEVYNKYRTRLVDLWAEAVSDGIVAENLPARIRPASAAAKRRQRLTLPGTRPGETGIDPVEAYLAIWNQADNAIRCAMELSVNALQRRHEVWRWRYDWSRDDEDGRHVYVAISKTRKHGVGSYVRIPEALPVVVSGFGARTLGEVIEACRDDVLCPYLVHRRPKRVRRSSEREHPFQLTLQQISKGFAEALDKSGLYAHLSPAERPTFHELLALGEHLRQTQGWSVHAIQVLRGHSQERTTRLYLDGHEWSTVKIPV